MSQRRSNTRGVVSSGPTIVSMHSDRKVRKFIRQWRRRYPYPVDWVDNRANKQCRRSEAVWLAQFEGAMTLKRRQVLSLIFWKLGGNAQLMEQALDGIEGPAAWGHARRQIKKALGTSNATAAFDCLLGESGGVPGWGPAMSSLVLAVCRPDTYAAADDRGLRTMNALGLYSPQANGEFVRSDWWPYLKNCREMAKVCGLSLRAVDQALWAAADDAPKLPKPMGVRPRRRK
jgi:hypothetical protein